MANIHTGELRPWDSLTPDQQQSGEWIKVPDGTEGGMARPVSLLEKAFLTPANDEANARLRQTFQTLKP